MNRTAYKTLSSELRKSLFAGEFHVSGSVIIIRQKNGLEAVSLDRSLSRSSLPCDRAWMTKASRRSLLHVGSKTVALPLPR